MTSMNRQQAKTVATILNDATNCTEVIIEEVTSETLKGAVAVTIVTVKSKHQIIVSLKGLALTLS